MYFFYIKTNNNYMLVALIIIFIVILILFIPFKLKVKLSYDILKNKGTISITLMVFRVFLGEFKILGKKLMMTYAKDKYHEVDINGIKNSSNFMDNFVINILKNIKVNTFKIYANIGYKYDAFLTAMLVSGINIFIQIAISQFLNRKPLAKVITSIFPNFCDTKLFFAISSSVSLNLYLIIMCAIIALFKIKKGVKSYENQSS